MQAPSEAHDQPGGSSCAGGGSAERADDPRERRGGCRSWAAVTASAAVAEHAVRRWEPRDRRKWPAGVRRPGRGWDVQALRRRGPGRCPARHAATRFRKWAGTAFRFNGPTPPVATPPV